MAIPSHVHRKFSETYGGRNNATRKMNDASNLEVAVDSNVDALKSGLREAGFSDADIADARSSLHRLHKEQGWY